MASVTPPGAPPKAKLSPLNRIAFSLTLLFLRILFRLCVRGAGHIPSSGGALLVSNGLSPIDSLLILSTSKRPVRFVVFPGDKRFSREARFSRGLGTIPLASENSPKEWLKSLRAVSDAVNSGEVVCLFAEGELSRIGQVLSFRREAERILRDLEAPVIPVALESAALGGVWRGDRLHPMVSALGGLRRVITVTVGSPLPAGTTLFAVREAILGMATDAWMERAPGMLPLHRAFVRTARRCPFRFAMGDARTPRLNFISALARTIYLGRRLAGAWADQEYVGILLPPSIAGALVNFAALLAGRIPVNLNYTASEETTASCIRQCGIDTVVTSKAFLEKMPLKLPGRVLLLEEIAATPARGERITALLMAICLPARSIEQALGRRRPPTMSDPATVIFSSGSTGEPKGVVLSHFNIASNIAQLERVFGPGPDDCFLGTLPFFHSFGFTGTLCLTGTLGIGVAYHPTPLDTAAVSRLVRDYCITFLLSTPTFLQLYLRGCAPEDFGSLRVVMAGAEKLSDRLAIAFEEKFGIRVLEGYGCTECAPVVAVNTYDFRGPGSRQVGCKRGTIGRPLPGITVRIVDRDTHDPLPAGREGLLLVRGPNVMQGYLQAPDKTADVLRQGWYFTGDIATLDEDGFVRITDRLSRFSKIGGEMVPHLKIEERLHVLIEATELTFVLSGVPDQKKGERLIVLHRLAEDRLRACLDRLAADDLPNLWKPKRDDFIRVEAFPLLGTGKLDLRRIKALATELSRQERAEINSRTADQPIQ